jgi:hypothetical protein
MALNPIRLTRALVESLFSDAITRLEAGQQLPNDTTLIQAAKDWLAERASNQSCNVLVNAATRRLEAKLAKAKADGHFATYEGNVRASCKSRAKAATR